MHTNFNNIIYTHMIQLLDYKQKIEQETIQLIILNNFESYPGPGSTKYVFNILKFKLNIPRIEQFQAIRGVHCFAEI